jgi:2-polyprenyl-3-methyl-5-hydroxy-6-metoxy-1,4-benzoquinol methylase
MTEKITYIDKKYINRTSPHQYFDMGMKDEWQKEVYLLAADILQKNNFDSVVDIGCGSAYKLLNFFPSHIKITGVEEDITYNWLKKEYPTKNWIKYKNNLKLEHHDLLICSDVIEHIVDVIDFVDWINSLSWKVAVISTPDKSLLYDESHIGPPGNGSHVREWTFTEFNNFLSQWFKVKDHLITNRGQATQTIILEKYE